ncbi:hypothetical protein [Streptomyces carpaticus]|uniref:Uncharacterized protein n=1 Tax=Streptomyces carpaticus TaxID=285558 RepID=A0ABV4ZLQ7_9ACTN
MCTASRPPTSEERLATAERVRTAEQVVNEVREAMTAAGVILPSLRIDLASCSGDAKRPLIDLGRCNLDLARKLASVLRGCAR